MNKEEAELKATELGLNLDELMLLRHLQDFTNSGKMDTVIHNGKMYYWVKYDKFVDDLPILNMKKTISFLIVIQSYYILQR